MSRGLPSLLIADPVKLAASVTFLGLLSKDVINTEQRNLGEEGLYFSLQLVVHHEKSGQNSGQEAGERN